MTTFSDQLYHLGGVPVGGLFTPGKAVFVKPYSGSDTASGKKPGEAVKTLVKALAKVTADANDVVYLVSESNSASGTTDYQSATLAWNKDGSHIVGIASGSAIASRARIAQLSTATSVAPLVTWSANNGSMRNVHVYHGVNNAASVGCFNVTGSRNYFHRCHFAGIGHDTQDAAGNYSLRVSGDENVFEDCIIGLDTIARGTAANSEILFDGQATRCVFKNCIIPTFAEAVGHQFVIAGASSLDRWVLFDGCTFVNAIQSTATQMTEALDLSAAAGGMILLKNCTLIGATDWEAATVSGIAYIDGAAPTAASSGLAVAVAAS